MDTERSLASNYFIFLKILFRFDVPTTQISIFVLWVNAGVLFDGAFCLWVSLMWD